MMNALKFLLGTICCAMIFGNCGYSMQEMSDSEFVQNLENRLKLNYTVIVTQDEIDKYESITGKKLISDDNKDDNKTENDCDNKK